MFGVFLTHKNFLWFNAHLNRTNHKGKYLWLKCYKEIAFYMHCIYKTFWVPFIHFYWKDKPTAFLTLGGLMCPQQKKRSFCARPGDQKLGSSLFLLCVHDHSTELYGPLSFIFSFVHDHSTKTQGTHWFISFICTRTFDKNFLVPFHLFFLLCTTIRPKIRVLIDLFLLFVRDHSTEIYDPLSFILSLVHDYSTKN